MTKQNNNKYYLYYEAYFSNWIIAHFNDKNNSVFMNPYKQTPKKLFFFSGINKKNSVCNCNDIEEIKKDFFKGCKQYHYNMALYEVDKKTYLEAIELLKNHDETKKENQQLFKNFYNKINNDFKNILK